MKFNLKRQFNSKLEYVDYLKTQPTFVINKSNLVTCKICKNHHHKMRLQYEHCNNVNCNETKLCPRQTKILTCKKNGNDVILPATVNSSIIIFLIHKLI
jgi:hypothetical protein